MGRGVRYSYRTQSAMAMGSLVATAILDVQILAVRLFAVCF